MLNEINEQIEFNLKRVASPGSMHDTGCLGLVHWDDPEGWYGEGGGRGVQDGEHPLIQSCIIHEVLYFLNYTIMPLLQLTLNWITE